MIKSLAVMIFLSCTLLFSQPKIEMSLKKTETLQIEIEFTNPDTCIYLVPIDCWYTSVQSDSIYELLNLFDNNSWVNQLVFLQKKESRIITPEIYNFSTSFIYNQEIPDFVELSFRDTFKVFIELNDLDPNVLSSNDVIEYTGIFVKYSELKHIFKDQNYISNRIITMDQIQLNLNANTLEHLELVDQSNIKYTELYYFDKFESSYSKVNIKQRVRE